MRYRFRCRNCGQTVEVEHPMDEPHPTNHNQVLPVTTACDGELERLFDTPNITYHGSGFYHTDRVLSDPINPLDYNPDED